MNTLYRRQQVQIMLNFLPRCWKANG